MTKQERDQIQPTLGGFRKGELQVFTAGIGTDKPKIEGTDKGTDIGRIREELYQILERLLTMKGETEADEAGLSKMFDFIDSAVSESKGITTI